MLCKNYINHWSYLPGYIWAEDKEHCEEYGRMAQADPAKVSMRAKKRGLPQVWIKFISILVNRMIGGVG